VSSKSSELSESPKPSAPSGRDVDPETGQSWPDYLDTHETARYLKFAYNLPIAPLTLVRQRTRGIGIRWKYLGQKPIAARVEVDRFVREDALRDVSPLKAGAQARIARAAKPPPPPAKQQRRRRSAR
jgi:hypothetical protein